MQQLSRVCMIADHHQRQIEYVCIYPECNSSRFACSKCVRMGNHRHQQQDQSHVLDNKELYEVLQEKLSKRQKRQGINIKQGANLQTESLKQIIQMIQNSLKNMINMIEQLEQGMVYNHSDEQLNQLLLKLRNNGFNQFDEVQINTLMNIDQQVGDIKTSLLDQSNNIIQNVKRIQECCISQQQDYGQQQKIRDSKQNVITQDQVIWNQYIVSSAISNDFKYIVSGSSKKKLKIWNYSHNKLKKSIYLDNIICQIKFTDDSRLLYVGVIQDLYQFDVNNRFEETYKIRIHSKSISNIICITNSIILTSSFDSTIIKTDVNLKQQLLLIKAHDYNINGLDYNHNLDMIASSNDTSIKIWNGNNGQLVLEKQNAHKNNFPINYVFFVIKGNQLISLDYQSTILVWKINYEIKQLEQQQKIIDTHQIFNISWMLNQQYISLFCREYIEIYSIKGDYIKQFNHDVKEFMMYNTIQKKSIKAIALQGKKTPKI